MRAAPEIFVTLSRDGAAAADDQRSLPRKALMILVAPLLMVSAPLFVAGPARSGDGSEGTLVKPIATASDTGTGNDTMGNTDAGGQDTGASTVGKTDGQDGTGQTERTEGTGVETQGQMERV
jgi:hypothetical protein